MRTCDIQELDNLILCAKWLVVQFENINCKSLAAIFQKSINDSEAWIENMVEQSLLPQKNLELIKLGEAESIRKILIKYASINDPDIRKDILDRMVSIANGSSH